VVIGIPPTAGGAPLGNWQRVERLTIRFDERGVVAAVGFEGRNCTGCRNVLSAGEAAGATR